MVCQIEVVRVLAYGAGVGSLPPGTTISIAARGAVLGLKEVANPDGSLPDKLLEYSVRILATRAADGSEIKWQVYRIRAPSEVR
jgi:hypothetical protein